MEIDQAQICIHVSAECSQGSIDMATKNRDKRRSILMTTLSILGKRSRAVYEIERTLFLNFAFLIPAQQAGTAAGFRDDMRYGGLPSH
jgi:hypothetical protein